MVIFDVDLVAAISSLIFLEQFQIKYTGPKGAAAYQLGNTSSHMITEVEQC